MKEIKEEKSCYIVTLATASAVSYDYEYYVCDTYDKARDYAMDLLMEMLTSGDYDEDVCEETVEGFEDDYVEDPDGGSEWFIRIESGKKIADKDGDKEKDKAREKSKDMIMGLVENFFNKK